jgi:DNA-binding NarL/FixJ family response regulator
MAQSFEALMTGDMTTAIDLADRAITLGHRFDDADLVSLTLHQKGLVLLGVGRTADGFAAMDEAMVTLATADLSPMVTGIVYCGVISGCWNAYELRRAHDWTAAMTAWCESQPELANFTGECKVRRAELKQLHGAWSEALDEVEQVEISDVDAFSAGLAAYVRGNLARLQGRFPAAEEAFRETTRLGMDPQPGLALLRLARGKTQAAATMTRRALTEIAHGGRRIELLHAAAEILLAVDDVDEATKVVTELGDTAGGMRSQVVDALATQAQAMLHLHQARPDAALTPLRASLDIWLQAEAPYQQAKTRILLADAYAALDDQESAERERESARALLEALGAVADLRALGGPQRDHTLTARELEVLSLLATGATNKSIAATLVLSERTVDRHVSNIFAKLGVTSRSAATASAFERQLV